MEGRPKRTSVVDKDYRERKRQRKSIDKTATSPASESNDYELIKQLYNDILQLKDPEDEEYEICTLFLDIPSKEDYPDYYETIKHPIALHDMKDKMDNKEYDSLADFKADIDLMVANAKKYNLKESQVYGDAVFIQKFVKQWQPKLKTVLKLPGGAFKAPSIKLKLRAVDKPKPKSTNIKPLMQAIQKKDTKKAMEILENDEDIDPNELVPVEMFKDKFTWSPLHAAAYYGDTKLMEALIERGADIELNDTWYNATPLGWAAYGDQEKAVKLLIKDHNANINAENMHGQVPFDVVPDQDDPKWIGLFSDAPIQKEEPPKKTDNTSSAAQIHIQQHPPVQKPSRYIATPSTYTTVDGMIRKRRGRPPKSETDEANARPTTEIDINTFDPVAFEIEIFNAIRTHTDNNNRLYSEQFEDLPDRMEYPEYYSQIRHPISLAQIADKMQKRMYPNLYAWMKDMKLVFENAMNFNEAGSRIFRDAKLLLRLLNRLKERVLARIGVPVSQEDDVFRLNLSGRPFDPEALSEDKRNVKRFLNNNKSRTQSIEPEQSYAMPNAYVMQQQQQLYQQLQLQQQQYLMPTALQSMPPQMAQPPTLMPPPSMLPQANLLQNSQLGMLSQANMPSPVNVHLHSRPSPPAMMSQTPVTQLPQSLPASTSAINNVATSAAAAAAAAAAALAGNAGASPTTTTATGAESPVSNLPKASKEFYALCQDETAIFINELKLKSSDDVYNMTIDGEYLNHSLSVPASVELLNIEPDLAKPLRNEDRRLKIVVLHNNTKLNTTSLSDWQSIPLIKGFNVIKINITANSTKPDSHTPEYKSKLYQLFVTRNW